MSDFTATAAWTNRWSAGWWIGRLAASVDRDVVSMIAVRLAVAFGGVLASILTARYLNPSQRGQYFLVYTLAQTLAQFGNFGLQSSNTYLVARDPSLAGPLLVNSVWTAVIAGGAGSVLVILALTAYGGPMVVGGLWLAAVLAPATLFYLLGVNLLVGLKRIATFNTYQLASNYVVLLCLIGAAMAGAGPTGFLAASALGWTAVSCGLLFALRRGAATTPRFRPDVFREGFRFALKAYAATLCGFIVVRGNVYLLNVLTSSEQVGYYSVASLIADAMGILPGSMALVLFPALITASGGQFRTTLKNMAVVGVLLGAGCAAVGLFAESFVQLVFGAKFLPTVAVLRWMLPGVFFLGLTSMLSQYLAASGFPAAVVVVWAGGSLAALSLGWLLIPGSAGIGAAIALSATHFGVFIAILALSVKHARRGGADVNRMAVVVAEGALS